MSTQTSKDISAKAAKQIRPRNRRPSPTAGSLIEAVTDEWLNDEPPPQEWLWEDRIPTGSVTTIIAEGGTGKSYFLLRIAMATALGSKRFLTPHHEPRALRMGTSVFINAEDPPDVVRRRFWHIKQRAISRLAKTYKGDELAKHIADYHSALKARFKMIHLVGKQFSLVEMIDNQLEFGPGLDKLLKELRALKGLVFVALDPLARLHTAEENSNSVNTKVIAAGETITQEFRCAVGIAHHVSKDAAARGNVSAHAGRGGSSLGDGARSVLRLIAAKPDDVKALKLLRFDDVPIDPRDIAEESVIVLHHAKSSYGKKQRPLFMLRDRDTGELLPLKAVADDRDMYAVNMRALADWLSKNPTAITKDTFRSATELRKRVFGSLSRAGWELLFETAVAKGDLIVDPNYPKKNPNAAGYMLKDGYPPDRQIPAGSSAGMPVVGADGMAGGIPAAGPDVLGGGYPLGGYPGAPESPEKPPRRPRKAPVPRGAPRRVNGRAADHV